MNVIIPFSLSKTTAVTHIHHLGTGKAQVGLRPIRFQCVARGPRNGHEDLAADTRYDLDRGASFGAGNLTTNTDAVDRDRNHDYGWVGLLGLSGLAALMKRRHRHDSGRVSNIPTGKNRS